MSIVQKAPRAAYITSNSVSQQIEHPKNNCVRPVRYLPAILHKSEGMGWLIEYYVLNPVTNNLERKRLRMNKLRKRFSSQAKFRLAANSVVATINAHLAGGWTPFSESENSRYYMQLTDVLHLYLKEKGKELKDQTMRSYNSFGVLFSTWLDGVVPQCNCLHFNRTLAVRYMDDYYENHSSNGRTYNNQLKMARAFFSWAKQKCYIKENPFEFIKTKKEPQKRRILVPAEDRQKARKYFEKKRPEMVIICEMIYTSLIRPIEISRITIEMLHLEEHYIAMPAAITKNGHPRSAPLSDDLCEKLYNHTHGKPGGLFLFGEGWKPGNHPINSKVYRKQWESMRKAVGMPNEMQLYSLRDTGAFDMLKAGIDPLTVMQAADWHDLSMVTRYANHVDSNIIRIIKEDAPAF